MDFLEKDLEEIIYNASKTKKGIEQLENKGLFIDGIFKRQLRIGNYGIADLVEFRRCFDNQFLDGEHIRPKLIVIVYELKKDKIGISAFLQALGYLKGIKRYLNYRKFNFDVTYRIVLIGKKLDLNSTFCYLDGFVHDGDGLDCFLMNYTYNYDIDGIKFNLELGYSIIDEGFNKQEEEIF